MLKREISRLNVFVVSAGGMVGSGWLFSPFISAQLAGPNALISWVLALFFMLIIALPLCELGTMFPVSGGMTNYPSFTHGHKVGFLFAWISWLSYVVMTPIEIQAIMQYSSWVFPGLIVDKSSALGLSPLGYLVAFSIMFFVVGLNLLGIKLVTQCNTFASVFKYLMPSLAIFCLMRHSDLSANIHLDLSNYESWRQIFSALSIGGVIFAFAGFQNGLMLAGEVKNPQKDIPISILGSIVIAFVLYFLLQWSFLISIPDSFLKSGWAHLHFHGDHSPLIGLLVLIGLSWVATILMFDAVFSPLGTTIIYTAATSRILYGMAINQHIPRWFGKVNSYHIPYVTIIVNLIVGMLSFLPFPSWQKMVAFLSSCCILSYAIGPICILAMRKLRPVSKRPFKLKYCDFFAYIAFFICNVMLYWCGFEIIWKLDVALLVGFIINTIYNKDNIFNFDKSVYWFFAYMLIMFVLSYLGSFGGKNILVFPWDMFSILPFSILILYASQFVLVDNYDFDSCHQIITEPAS